MLITTLIYGATVADFDSKITEKLSIKAGSIKAVHNERMRVAVRNEKGEIYRAMGVTGLGDFLGVVEQLADIGLVDELKDVDSARHGYDAIFSA